MSNLIQLLIAAILGGHAFLEEGGMITTVETCENIEIATSSSTAFLPEEDSLGYERENVFYYSPIRLC